MATVTTTTKPGAPMPWRGLSRFSQEQVIAVIVVLLLLGFTVACRDLPRCPTFSGSCVAFPFSASLGSEWGLL